MFDVKRPTAIGRIQKSRKPHQLATGALGREQDMTILYFGDYNPSGSHAPVGIRETMAHYGLDLGAPTLNLMTRGASS